MGYILLEKTCSTGFLYPVQHVPDLGLAIVKKIMELHNANIRMQSKLHEGTSFIFHLPVVTG